MRGGRLQRSELHGGGEWSGDSHTRGRRDNGEKGGGSSRHGAVDLGNRDGLLGLF